MIIIINCAAAVSVWWLWLLLIIIIIIIIIIINNNTAAESSVWWWSLLLLLLLRLLSLTLTLKKHHQRGGDYYYYSCRECIYIYKYTHTYTYIRLYVHQHFPSMLLLGLTMCLTRFFGGQLFNQALLCPVPPMKVCWYIDVCVHIHAWGVYVCKTHCMLVCPQWRYDDIFLYIRVYACNVCTCIQHKLYVCM